MFGESTTFQHVTAICAAVATCLAGSHARSDGELASFKQPIPSAAVELEMIAIAGDEARGIAPFWIGKTELCWEAFDVFVYRLDEPEPAPAGADAITRPTKPYLPPDRGFGHDGFAAIGMSHRNAAAFCEWLSKKSGKRFRLPTEAEWELACRAGNEGAYSFGSDVARLGEHAWFKDNASGKAQRVATKLPNALGLFDMHGNVAEWCDGADGKPVTKGGCYADPAEKLASAARAPLDPAWNRSDPQVPKSKWWLSDAPFVGFRVVCVPDRPKESNP